MKPQLPPLSLIWFSIIGVFVIALDQATKLAVDSWLVDRPPVVIVPGFFQLVFRTNTGAAFSAFREHPSVLTIFASCIVVFIFVWSIRLREPEQALRWPLGLILGGACGNLIDRVRLGHVVDFLDAYWSDHHFPTFNVADSSIFIGMCLMIWLSFTMPETHEDAESEVADAAKSGGESSNADIQKESGEKKSAARSQARSSS